MLRQTAGLVRTVLVVLTIVALTFSTPAYAAVLKLSGPLSPNHDVLDFRVSPDGKWVAYTTGEFMDAFISLNVVPATGGTPIQIYSDPALVRSYSFTADSQRIVFIAPRSGPNGSIYSRNSDGSGSNIKLNTTSTDAVYTFAISGNYAVYFDAMANLYSVPIDGSAPPVQLNFNTFVANPFFDVWSFSVTGDRVIYRARVNSGQPFELYSVPLAGPNTASIKLNPALVSGGAVEAFSIDPTGNRVVYRALQDSPTVAEYYSVPANGSSGSVRIFSPLPGLSISWQVLADYVIFNTNKEDVSRTDVYRVPIAGPESSVVRLNDLSLISQSVFGIAIRDRAFYWTACAPCNRHVYVVPLSGPASASKLLADHVYNLSLGQTGNRLVYVTDTLSQTLQSVPTSGTISDTVALSNDNVGLFGFSISPDESRVVYLSPRSGSTELYSVPINGPISATVKISGPMTSGGNVEGVGGIRFSPDGRSVFYRADQEADSVIELFTTDEGYLLTQRVFLPLIQR